MSLVGNLEDLGLGEILQIVSLSRKSGVLFLHSRGREARIVFRSGQVIRASSTSFQQNIGEVLIQKGVIDLATLKRALVAQKDGDGKELLGAILIKQFGASAEAIESVVREQIENVVYSLFAWAEGSFEFEVQDTVEAVDNTTLDPLQFMLDQGLNPQFLAMEGSRIIDEKRHRGEVEETDVDVAGDMPTSGEDLFFNVLQSAEPASSDIHPQIATEKRNLVIVTEDPGTNELLKKFLGDNGYDVIALTKGEDALVLIDSFYRGGVKPTVILDLFLARMDGTGTGGGIELLALLRNNFSDIPVLVSADRKDPEIVRTARSMGYAIIMRPRPDEMREPSRFEAFKKLLLPELARVESGGGAIDWNSKINIGDELRLEMGEEPSLPAQPAPQSTGISLLRGMLDELNNPSLGGGIILLVLRFAAEFMNRAVVLIVKRDEISGLGQFGIMDKDGLADTKIRNLTIPRNEDSLFCRVIESQATVKGVPDDSKWNRYFFQQLGGAKPMEYFAGPIVSEGKVVAIMYGDNSPETRNIGDTDSLEIFLSQAGIAMEKALLQRRLKEKGQEGM